MKNDITQIFEQLFKAIIDLTRESIKVNIHLYVQKSIESDIEMKKWNSNIKSEALNVLVNRVKGM